MNGYPPHTHPYPPPHTHATTPTPAVSSSPLQVEAEKMVNAVWDAKDEWQAKNRGVRMTLADFLVGYMQVRGEGGEGLGVATCGFASFRFVKCS